MPERRRRRRLNGSIFYPVYAICIIAFFVALAAVIVPLKDWLVRYEAAQPNHKRDEVFHQIFEARDWGRLYELAGVQNTAFEDETVFAALMNDMVGQGELTCLETSAGLSGDKKFIVKAGDKKIATFLLTGGTDNEMEIASWELKSVEVSLPTEASVTVQRLPGQTVYINGKALDDSYTIHRTTTLADSYLPVGEHGFMLELQRVTGLWQMPQVEVKDAAGNSVAITLDEETGIYTQEIASHVLTDEFKTLAENTARAYCKYMINASGHELWRWFDEESEAYKEIIRFEQWTVQSYQGYKFTETTFDDFYQYSDDCFSVVVDLTLNVTRGNGTIKPYHLRSTLVFAKNEYGKFHAVAMTNIDIQEKQEQVKLTFKQGDAEQIIWVDPAAPKLEVPSVEPVEGKIFKGWVTESKADDGKVMLTVVFDENGQLRLEEGKTLTAMVLTPLFE